MRWSFLDHPVPFGIAHQGGTDVAPGNTEAAFQHAVSLGYRYIETDVQSTSDGVLVVFHDDELGPTTGAEGCIADRTWLELADVRVGGEHPIPRFEDMLERFPDTRFNVEPKTDRAVDVLSAMIRDEELLSRICVGSFRDSRIDRMREALGPNLCMSPGPLGLGRLLLRAIVGSSKQSTFAAVQIPKRFGPVPLTSASLVKRFHKQGLQVHVWTINDEAAMNALLDNEVDAIMSDEVTTLREVLRRRGHWPAVSDGGAFN